MLNNFQNVPGSSPRIAKRWSSLLGMRVGTLVGYGALVLSITFNSCYALATVAPFDRLLTVMLVLGLVGCVILGVHKVEKKLLPVDYLAIALALFIFLSGVANASPDNASEHLHYILLVALALACVRCVPLGTFVRGFLAIMKFITIIALIGWVSSNLLGITAPFPVVENVNGAQYSSGLVVFQYVADYFKPFASLGIFWEGGVYASFLLIAILLEFTVMSRRNAFDIILFTIALLTTRSTAGILILPLCLFVPLVANRFRWRYLLFFGVLFFLAIALFNLDQLFESLYRLNPSLFGKIIDTDMVTTSTRMLSPQICWNLFLESPIVGHGSAGATYLYASIISGLASVNSLTTTTLYVLAAFGVGGIVMTAAWFYGIVGQKKLSAMQKILILIILFLIANKEPHSLTAIMYCFMFYLVDAASSKTPATSVEAKRP